MSVAPSPARALAEARRLWPRLPDELATFEERLGDLGTTTAQLEAHGHELYLAHCCSVRHSVAIEIFEREFRSVVDAAILRIGRRPEFVADVRQAVLERLFVGPPPRIGHYSGSGPLGAWIRVTATRVALNHVGRRRDDVQLVSDAIVDVHRPAESEREVFRAAVREAIVKAFTTLSTRERNVFRLYYAEALNIDRIGELYGMHRATVARWLAGTKKRIFDDVRSDLKANFRLSDSEAHSVLADVRSQLEISFTRLFDEVIEQSP